MNDDAPEVRLEQSWRTNASAWTRAVREQRIASRRAGTDAAIVEAVLSKRAQRVLDLGCGEGWLARSLARAGCEVIGIDASPELIEAANELGDAQFAIASYVEFAERGTDFGQFDVAVCNFSLLGEDLQTPLHGVHELLVHSGVLLVQTVHPWTACGEAPYVNGWRDETFANFGGDFSAAMPWYFRTMSGWIETLRAAGFTVERLSEPLDPVTGDPLSLLIHAIPTHVAASI